jgi:hypothetical protein
MILYTRDFTSPSEQLAIILNELEFLLKNGQGIISGDRERREEVEAEVGDFLESLRDYSPRDASCYRAKFEAQGYCFSDGSDNESQWI